MRMFEAQLRSLLVDGACRNIVRHLEAEGFRPILLKGASIARWLYQEDPDARVYSDLDVLVASTDRAGVIRALADLDFRPLVDDLMLRTSSVEETPLADSAGVCVDLHTTLKGVQLDPEGAWTVLDGATVPFDWHGTPVRVLSLPARAMHLALHLAQRGLVDQKAAEDLRRGLDQIDDATWNGAFEFAETLDATGSFAAGLALLPGGSELLDRLGCAPPSSREAQMRAGSASFSALFVERAVSARSWRQRLRVVRGRLFPSTSWLRLHEPEATRTRWGLARTRVMRPIRVVARLPLAVAERNTYRDAPRC